MSGISEGPMETGSIEEYRETDTNFFPESSLEEGHVQSEAKLQKSDIVASKCELESVKLTCRLVLLEISGQKQKPVAKDVLPGLPEAVVPGSLRLLIEQTPQSGADIRRSFDELLRGEKTPKQVRGDLLVLGPEAIPYLVAGLGSSSFVGRELCQATLLGFGRRATAVLFQAIDDPTSSLELSRRARSIILNVNEGQARIVDGENRLRFLIQVDRQTDEKFLAVEIEYRHNEIHRIAGFGERLFLSNGGLVHQEVDGTTNKVPGSPVHIRSIVLHQVADNNTLADWKNDAPGRCFLQVSVEGLDGKRVNVILGRRFAPWESAN